MGGDNKDRYGYRHRNDPDYGMGESKPGDVGDSQGTFHDRARKNSNVVVDGEVRSQESYERAQAEVEPQKSDNKSSGSTPPSEKMSQSEADGKVVELTVESTGGTLDSMGHFKNHQVHLDGGTPGETIRVRLESGPGYLIGRRVSLQE